MLLSFLDEEEEGSAGSNIFPAVETTEATSELVSVDMVTGDLPVLIMQASTESELIGEIETHKPPTTTTDFLYVEQNVTQLPLSSPPSTIDDLEISVTVQPELGLDISDENGTEHVISLTGKKLIYIRSKDLIALIIMIM